MNEPRRLLDDPSTHDALRAALEAGRELPDEAQLASLTARLGPLLGPGGGGGGGSAGAAASGGATAIKASLGLLAAAAATTAIVWSASVWPSASEPPVSATPGSPAREIVEPAAAPAIPEGLDVPDDLTIAPDNAAAENTAPSRPRVRSDPAPIFETDPEAELALIRSAQDALRTSPAAALARTDEHRRRFGEGALGQEREVVAIDALVRAGREADARERAAAFHRRWPRSAHGRRVDVLVGPR